MVCQKVFAFGTGPFDPTNRFQTSWFLTPRILFALRAFISFYIFFTLFFIIGYTCAHESEGGCLAVRQSFSYFTVITYWGLGFYFLTSAIHTFTYATYGRPLLDNFPRPLQALHSLFYTTIITLPFLVTIVYWGVIYKAPWFPLRFDAWHNVSQHGLNSLFALIELSMTRTELMPWVHLLWLILILMGYLAIAFITLATQGWYTYSFLDHDQVGGRGHVAAYVCGIAVAIVIVFCVVRGLVWLRLRLTKETRDKTGRYIQQKQSLDVEMNLGQLPRPSDKVNTRSEIDRVNRILAAN